LLVFSSPIFKLGVSEGVYFAVDGIDPKTVDRFTGKVFNRGDKTRSAQFLLFKRDVPVADLIESLSK